MSIPSLILVRAIAANEVRFGALFPNIFPNLFPTSSYTSFILEHNSSNNSIRPWSLFTFAMVHNTMT
jgi:hypothetical protein